MSVNIHIKLSGGSNATTETGTNTNTNLSSSNNTASNVSESPSSSISSAKIAAISIATMVGKQTLTYATSNIGKWTGNSARQQQVDNVMQMAEIVAAFRAHPLIGLAAIGINLATAAIDYNFEQNKNMIEVSNARARAGYSSTEELLNRRH